MVLAEVQLSGKAVREPGELVLGQVAAVVPMMLPFLGVGVLAQLGSEEAEVSVIEPVEPAALVEVALGAQLGAPTEVQAE